MPHPGITFAVLIGVAIGTAIYYIFNQEDNNQQRQNAYNYDGAHDNEYVSDYNSWTTTSSASSSSSQRRRRSVNSNSKCSICLDDINKKPVKRIVECGHEFHYSCINMWFKQNRNCPNCRTAVS